MTTEEKEFPLWLEGLHPKRREEFIALNKEHQAMVENSPEKSRKRVLKTLNYARQNINGRNKWVMGLEQLAELVQNPQHYLLMMFRGRTEEVEAMLDILLDFKDGEHENTKNTDPVIFDLISKAYFNFEKHSYGDLDGIAVAEHFKRNPHLRPLSGKHPTERQMAEREFLKVGSQIKEKRKAVGFTQEEMANATETSTKTIKNLEAGKPVSSHTLLAVQRFLSHQAEQTQPPSQTKISVKLNP